jgi:hypothetical protein
MGWLCTSEPLRLGRYKTLYLSTSIAFPLSMIAVYWLPFTCFEGYLNLAEQQLP